MIRRILVPLDGSPLAAAAVPYAVTLARALDAPIGLLAVVAPFPDLLGVPSDDAIEGDDRRVAATTDYLDTVATAIRAHGFSANTAVRHGNPASEILSETEETEGVLVVMSTHGRTGLDRLRFGSVARHVFRHAVIPTLVVRPSDAEPAATEAAIPSVTVTLDGSPLAEEALPLAARLAAALAVPLTLLRVIPSLPATEGWGTGYVSYYPENSALERDEERGVADYLEAVAAPLRAPGLAVATEWRRSPTTRAADCVATYLAERPTGIAVMASHGRGGVLRWALGSTTEAVLDQAPCPILVVRAGATSTTGSDIAPARAMQYAN